MIRFVVLIAAAAILCQLLLAADGNEQLYYFDVYPDGGVIDSTESMKRTPMDRSSMVRFGKRVPMDRISMVRFGKRAPMDRSSMVRFGKRVPIDRSSMVRFGKRDFPPYTDDAYSTSFF